MFNFGLVRNVVVDFFQQKCGNLVDISNNSDEIGEFSKSQLITQFIEKKQAIHTLISNIYLF